MNKKFLSAILFGALMVTSTGTFVSCKDYDEDIDGLQTQVDANKSALTALDAELASLKSAAAAAQSTADAAKAAAAAAKTAGDAAAAAAAEAKAAAAQAKIDAIADATAKVEAVKVWVAEQGYATQEELAAALAIVGGQIEGVEGGLSELVDYAKGLEEQLGTLSATTLSNIVALQEDLDTQKAAIEKLLNSTTDEALAAELEDLLVLVSELETNVGQSIGNLENRLNDLDETLAAKFDSQDTFIAQLSQAVNTLVDDLDSKTEELWAAISGEGANSIRTQLGQLAGVIATVQGELATLHTLLDGKVVSVDIHTFSSSATSPYCPTFYNTIEKAAVFGDKTAIKANENLTFTAGKLHAGTTEVVIRVSPTNVQITKEQITLINSLGGNLNDYVEVAEVKPYDKLVHGWNSRSAVENKSGMWTVNFRLKETTDVEEFLKAATTKVGNNTYGVRFAVAVDNVISAHSLEFDAKELVPASKLDFFVNDKNIEKIANRYATYTSVEEMKWKGAAAVEAILTPAEDKNVVLRADAGATGTDDRTSQDILPVVKGEEIAIRINATKNGNEWVEGDKIAGFYVTLDKAYALESAVSEINAWNSYEYENVGTDKQTATMFKGNYGTITIKNLNNVVGDIIGFRVYAVNLDGTLMDPDGRAFYVSVGNPAATAQTISATITPKAKTETSVTVELTSAQSALITSLLKDEYKAYNTGVVMSTANTKIEGVNTEYGIEYVWNDDKTAVVKVTFTLNDVANFIDDETYKASTTFYNETKHELGTVNFELTKTMPTAFPAEFAFRPKQEVEDGTGKFIAYMIPDNGYAAASEKGTKDLNNVFYGLDANYEFIFATSAIEKDQNNKDVVVDNEVIDDDDYVLEVAKSFINNTTWHNVTVSYLYNGISTYYDAEKEEYVKGANHKVAYGKTLQVKYACWENASAFVWDEEVYEDLYYDVYEEEYTMPVLQWTAEGTGAKAELETILSTNSYNNDYFGLSLDKLIDKKWLRLATAADNVEEPVKLEVNGQVNPYFVPAISGTTITFTQAGTQVDAAPVADHKETLKIAVVDAYGHVTTIALEVTVKAPAKK